MCGAGKSTDDNFKPDKESKDLSPAPSLPPELMGLFNSNDSDVDRDYNPDEDQIEDSSGDETETFLKKCAEKIPDNVREAVFEDYWKMNDYNKRCNYIAALIEVSEPKRKRERKDDSDKVRMATVKYHVEVEGPKNCYHRPQERIGTCSYFVRRCIKKTQQSMSCRLVITENIGQRSRQIRVAPMYRVARAVNKHIPEDLIKEEQDNTKRIERKRKLFKNEIESDSVPVKLRVVNPPQGLKRKQKINLPTKHDFESDYEYDDGTLDIPKSKRGAIQIPNDDNSDMETVRTDEEEEMETTTTAVTPARSDVYEKIYQTRPT
ncbi:hypothetical protein J6590_107272, partial [Homalodisca vitripennis]